MSYQRIETPKIYTDNINWLLTLGKINSSNISVAGLSLASGSDKMGLFDMKPSNLQTITANTSTDTGYITINTGISTDSIVDNTFVAIYTRYSNHANGTYKIAEIMHRAPHSVHARALRLRDLGVNLPEAYYNRARSRVNVEELNQIIREVLSRRSRRSRRNFA